MSTGERIAIVATGPEASWDTVGQTEMVPQGRRSRNAGAVVGWKVRWLVYNPDLL